MKGQDNSIEINFNHDFIHTFTQKYRQIYGHWVENREIEIESIRVIATEKKTEIEAGILVKNAQNYAPKPHHFTESFIQNKWQTVPVFFRNELTTGATIDGFALLLDNYSTTVIEENFSLTIDKFGTGILNKNNSDKIQIKDKNNSQTIDLELFTNRFTNIAENMGVMLQRTALSVNVKERLDFSCALLDADGELIANAPHIPVHLGSLGVCVREVLKRLKIEKGDTVITNHPAFGGSHLPDVTLITGVFTDENKLIGYVCNRCHHSEIGGTRPASMPPDATTLVEEGVIIEPMYLVKNDVINWESIRYKLLNAPYPTRSIEENVADLNAALAANYDGVKSLTALVTEHGLETVHFYMKKLKDYTAEKLNEALKAQFTEGVFSAEETLDDGTVLRVKISIKKEKIVFDFNGSAPVHKGNLNANRAIVSSVVIYVLRLLLKDNIPLNEGIMKHVSLILPENSILNPHFSLHTEGVYPAVVGGNVETSQRLTDTILKALGIIACGQGTMNNVLFGNENFGYYETICGGAGATATQKGADAVHTNMTNTRITDPEIMELRYPVRLEEFSIRRNSGGKGRHNGGDGITRRITFLAPVELSILSQHRKVAPFGLNGGGNGQIGKQFLILKHQKRQILRGIDGASVEAGDELVIQTPGGGGFGRL